MSARGTPVVERRYAEDPQAQESALKLLISHTDKAARISGGKDAEERIESAPQRIPSLPASR